MTGKGINNGASGCLVLILPLAFLMSLLFIAWPLILALVLGGAGLRVWQNYQWQQWSQQVNPYFHQLIQENQGAVTPLELAMKANLSGIAAQRYLETKAEEFGAQRRNYQEKGDVYYFITSSTLGSILDDSEPPIIYEDAISNEEDSTVSTLSSVAIKNLFDDQESTTSESEISEVVDSLDPLIVNVAIVKEAQVTDFPVEPKSLIQSELAKRLDVHSSTILKRRSEPYFSEWSQSRDPDGIAWKYSRKTRLFVPVNSESLPK